MKKYIVIILLTLSIVFSGCTMALRKGEQGLEYSFVLTAKDVAYIASLLNSRTINVVGHRYTTEAGDVIIFKE